MSVCPEALAVPGSTCVPAGRHARRRSCPHFRLARKLQAPCYPRAARGPVAPPPRSFGRERRLRPGRCLRPQRPRRARPAESAILRPARHCGGPPPGRCSLCLVGHAADHGYECHLDDGTDQVAEYVGRPASEIAPRDIGPRVRAGFIEERLIRQANRPTSATVGPAVAAWPMLRCPVAVCRITLVRARRRWRRRIARPSRPRPSAAGTPRGRRRRWSRRDWCAVRTAGPGVDQGHHERVGRDKRRGHGDRVPAGVND